MMREAVTSGSGSGAKRVAVAIDLDQCVPWHQDCCEGILRFGESRGWSCVIDPFLIGPGGRETVESYAGVVGRIDAELALQARELGIPVVNHWANTPVLDLPGVHVDERAGGEMAGDHLVMAGYRQLGYLGLRGDRTSRRVLEGLGLAAERAGQSVPVSLVIDIPDSEISRRQWMSRLMSSLASFLGDLSLPAGLMVGESTIARYLAQLAPQHGVSVPEDLGLVVWNDDMSTSAITPTLTVIEHDWFEVGYQSAAMLEELMEGRVISPRNRMSKPVRLIERDSTDVFICEDELVRSAMRYITRHCRKELKIDEIADALETSRRTLYRRFDEVLGRSIKDEITRVRIGRLKVMLEETQQTLSQIAESFGFSSPGQFSRFFNHAVGMTPSAYRERFRKQD